MCSKKGEALKFPAQIGPGKHLLKNAIPLPLLLIAALCTVCRPIIVTVVIRSDRYVAVFSPPLVRYVAVIDSDELIVPLSEGGWPALLRKLDHRGITRQAQVWEGGSGHGRGALIFNT